jgi:hypothetical protein
MVLTKSTKEVIRSRKSRDRQYNGIKEKGSKGQTMIYKTLHRNVKIEENKPHDKPGDGLIWPGMVSNFCSTNDTRRC